MPDAESKADNKKRGLSKGPALLRRLLLSVPLLVLSCLPYTLGIVEDPILNPFYLVALVIALLIVCIQPQKQRAVVRMSILFFVGIVTLALADLVLRPVLRERLHYRAHEMFAESHPDYPALPRYTPNRYFRGTEFGDLAAASGNASVRVERKVEFETDAAGFRNRRQARTNPIDTLVIGDSFGVGVGVSQDETWSELLRTHYGQKVYNLSYPGSPWRGLMRLTLELDQLELAQKTTVIWAFFVGNDLHESYLETMHGKALPKTDLREHWRIRWATFRSRSPIQKMWRNLVATPNRSHLGERVLFRTFLDDSPILFHRDYLEAAKMTRSDITNHYHFPLLEETYKTAADVAKQHNLQIKLVVVPTKAQIYSWLLDGNTPWSTPTKESPITEILREMAEELGFDFLDLAPDFINESKRLFEEEGQLLWWRDDTHWNPQGNRYAAERIHEAFWQVSPNQASRKGNHD